MFDKPFLLSTTPALICLALPLTIWLLVYVARSGTRRRQREALAASWQHMLDLAGTTPGAHLCQVTQVYQRARRGDKAFVAWWAGGRQQDAWFENRRVTPGASLLVRVRIGYGPHNNNPELLWVYPHDILAVCTPAAQRAWQKQHTG